MRDAILTAIPAILVCFLVLGSVMTIIGIENYNALIQTNYQPPASKFGLVIFSSPWTKMERNGQVEIKIYDIATNGNTAELNVVCAFSTNDTTTTRLLFGMQLPHNFSHLVVNVDMQSMSRPQGQGGGLGNPFFLSQSRGVNEANGLFYFWVIIDRSDSSLSPWDKFRFNATMILNEPLYQKSYTTYELITQFDSSFPTIPPSVAPQIPGETFSYFTPASSNNYLLEIAPPEHSRMETNPAADNIVFRGIRTWYLWDLSQKPSGLEFFGTAVLADFEMLYRVEQREILIFRAGIFLGVGLPLALTMILELLREVRDRTPRTRI
jgi:hypothetical protein